MTRCQYTPEFKSKVVLNILQDNQELNEICAQHNLNHNKLRKWEQEFLQNEFSSPRGLRKGLIDYINEYNKVRPHEALLYSTPDSYYYGQNVA